MDRDANGIRQFRQKEIEWIQFLGKLKEMEMPIAQMRQYAQLRAQGGSTIRDRTKLLAQHKQLILEKMDRLLENIRLLEDKIEIYKKMEETNHE